MWTAKEDVSVDMSLWEGKTIQNRKKKHDGIIYNHRCERNQPHNMGSFQIQKAVLLKSYACLFKQSASSTSHTIGTF